MRPPAEHRQTSRHCPTGTYPKRYFVFPCSRAASAVRYVCVVDCIAANFELFAVNPLLALIVFVFSSTLRRLYRPVLCIRYLGTVFFLKVNVVFSNGDFFGSAFHQIAHINQIMGGKLIFVMTHDCSDEHCPTIQYNSNRYSARKFGYNSIFIWTRPLQNEIQPFPGW